MVKSVPASIFITGASGFVGRALIQTIQSVPGTFQPILSPKRLDIRDRPGLIDFFSHVKPDYVIHLAAQSFVPRSFELPGETFEINFLGTLNLLEALRAADFSGRLLYVGSGDQYGLVPESELPILETRPLMPRNPYAVSKAAAEMLCFQWSLASDFDIVMARPFNHIGPWQSETFALSGFARQIVEIKLGRHEPRILTGDLAVTRDFSDVSDVARAYLLLLAHGHQGDVYNVCSGQEFRLDQLLEQMLNMAGVTADIMPDPARFRPAEQKRAVGSNLKLRSHTDWQPQVSIEQSLQNILNDWEAKLK